MPFSLLPNHLKTLAVVALIANSVMADDPVKVQSEKQANGELVHRLKSPRQANETLVRVLLPDDVSESEKLRVLFVLPVEAGQEQRFGDGLSEIQRLGLHNKHRLICVAPTFSHLPWYADHPTDSTIQQESYLLRDVIPLIDAQYSTTRKAEDRLLLGFSKSGWGAFSLVLRHPQVFGKAVAWDAPLMMNAPGKYGSGPIFGTAENFKAYQLTELVKSRAAELKGSPRLLHVGFGNFRAEHENFEQQLLALQVGHIYVDGPQRKHIWESGWIEPAVRMLLLDTAGVSKPLNR